MKTNRIGLRRLILVGSITVAIVSAINLAVYRHVRKNPEAFGFLMTPSEQLLRAGTGLQPGTGYAANYRQTDDGRDLLWAQGPKELESGEWFDVTGSPLNPRYYGNGIGKDTIPAIDDPEYMPISDEDTLSARGLGDNTKVFGYVHNGDARAYPVDILHYHEVVNDEIGGKPVTVGW